MKNTNTYFSTTQGESVTVEFKESKFKIFRIHLMGKLYNYANNTSYASQKISAPREVTLFSFNHWVQNISKNLLFLFSQGKNVRVKSKYVVSEQV